MIFEYFSVKAICLNTIRSTFFVCDIYSQYHQHFKNIFSEDTQLSKKYKFKVSAHYLLFKTLNPLFFPPKTQGTETID